MTTPGFTVFTAPDGNLYVVDGTVAQLRTGVRLAVGSGLGFSPISPSLPAGDFVPVSSAITATFVGGSGRNMVATGLAIPLSGAMPPVGLFVPGRPDYYHRGAFTLEVNATSSATISDATDVVAELTTGGTAPVGNYVATAYGKTTYNGGSDFTIAVALEIAGGGAIPDHLWTVSAGTAPGGSLVADDAALFTDSADADWTLNVNADGTADLFYLATIIASRDGGSNLDPDGPYTATQDGMDDYNSGEPWTAFVTVSPRPPRAGFVYVKITESAGILTTAEGPYFATALPADSGETYHVPIAQSDGTAIEQFHTGLLIIDAATRGGKIPSSYDEMTTPVTTTSATLEDITGVSTDITLAAAGEIAVWLNCAVSSNGICDLGLAVNIGGTDHDEVTVHLNGASDSGVASVIHRSGELAAGTYTVKGRFRRISGSPKIPGVDRADMLVMALRGPAGPPGAAPSGTGLVSVTSGAYDTPSTLASRLTADAANLRTALGVGPTAGNTSLITLGTVTTGTWNAGVIAGQYGGTGVDNTGKTITLAGNLATTGAYNLTIAQAASVTMTLPATSFTAARTDAAQTFTGLHTFTGAVVGNTTERLKLSRASTEYAANSAGGSNICWLKTFYDTTEVGQFFMDGGWNVVANNARTGSGGFKFACQGTDRLWIHSTGTRFNVPGAFGTLNAGNEFYGDCRLEFSNGGTDAMIYATANGTTKARIRACEISTVANLKILELEGSQILLNSPIVVHPTRTPSSATDTGTAGQICWDASYVYVCTATNTWKRSAIATW